VVPPPAREKQVWRMVVKVMSFFIDFLGHLGGRLGVKLKGMSKLDSFGELLE
jgi:hypothetical protein